MFGGDEDDADFLSPSGGAKLASLFGLDQTVSGPANESFQYTAPKQPKKGPGPAGSKAAKPGSGSSGAGAAPSVLFATAVHAHRYVNGQFVKQGKFGAAVLGNHTTKEYRILLYISQQQPVTAAKIHPGFVFTVQLNNYAAFYDDQRQSWSIMFESDASALEFSKQVCLAKCNSSPSLDAVLSQDLRLGDGQDADVGDLLEVAYTGWLFQSHGLGQVFDSNVQKEKLLRLKLGSGKVIKGWEEGMLGMKKGGIRLLIIPSSLAYGSQGVSGRIPPNSTLVFEVEVKRMKVKDLGSDRQSIGSRDSPLSITDSLPAEALSQPPTSVPPKPGEPAVRAKSNSISEQLANPDMTKAKLISRMAKMGQPMLPFLAGSTTPQPDSSDSEIEDPNMNRAPSHPVAPLPLQNSPQMGHAPAGHIHAPAGHIHAPAGHIHAPVPQQPVPGLPVSSSALLPAGPIHSQALPPGTTPAFQPYTGIQYAYPQTPAPPNQLQPVGPMYPSPLQPASFQASGDVTSFLMTEARQHNTEIRMAISKVVDKIDNLASKVDTLQKDNTTGASRLLPGISSITMESAMIMNNIQRIIQENERLKQEVLDKSSRIGEQNVKIGELITRNQRYVEQSNLLMEQRNDSLQTTSESTQARMLHAAQEKAKVTEELAAATGQVSRLQLELTSYQKKEMDLRTRLDAALAEADKHRTQLSALQVQLIEVQENSEQTKTRAKTEKESRRLLGTRLSALEDEVSDLKAEKETLEKTLAERKRKSQQERQRAEEEQEEMRKTLQEEMENLRQLLKKAREQAAAEQFSSSRERDAQRLAALQGQADQLQPLQEKNEKLQRRLAALLEEQRRRIGEEEARAPEKDTTEEVKKIMNGVFQTLRGEFDLEETYKGRVVLGTIMSSIKATTLQLLNKQPVEEPPESSEDEEEEEMAEVEETNLPRKDPDQIDQSRGMVIQDEDPGSPELLEEEETSQHITEEATDIQKEKHEEPVEEKALDTQHTAPIMVEEPVDVEILHTQLTTTILVKKPVEEVILHTQLITPVLVEDEAHVQVEVIQENLDAPSALVHMFSSDLPESSTVIYPTENGEVDRGTTPEIGTSNEIADGSQESMEAQVVVVDGSNTKLDQEDLEEVKPEVPPPLWSDEESGSPVPPTEVPSTHNSRRAPQMKEKVLDSPAKVKHDQNGSRDDSEEEDLFKVSPKIQKPKREEEEEEEVSLKGRPPPAPLFGDEEEDDDDLGWLS